ncbi:MAG: ISNCY family transposase [Chromatiaceae bacterium]|nr:ISNCY family transposase [Chromatiaceae bacterium]MBP8290795.1 ISNCY family transposase [Chromatiaceae bacterium]MBP9604401.1 ISNCY family transposase [Chromatiaceae bacterium]
MTQRALHRLKVVEAVTDRRLTQAEAGGQLGLTPRQVKRLAAAYRARGAAGLVSRRVGQPSNRRIKEPLREAIRALLVERYPDFGPTLAQEKLYELHQIEVSIETVRQLQVELGLWKPQRRQTARAFQLRERRGRCGELIQIDGSPHAWFEGRGPRCTLIVFIDDATGRLLQLEFAPSETTAVYMFVLRRHLERYGRPVALYSDRHSIFRINPVEPANGATTTQFGRALAGLAIEAIHARTPQAKGRVERANQTLQDRLVKELRLRGINDLARANAYLPAFIADFNPRFAVAPSSEEDAHRPLAHPPRALDLLLAEQEERTLSKNLTLQYRNVAYQLRHNGPGYRLRGAKVTVCDLANGEVVLLREGRELPYTTYRKGERPPPVADEKTLNERVDRALEKQQQQRSKPAPDHPWRMAAAMAAARTAT